jgi:hypothetical protein
MQHYCAYLTVHKVSEAAEVARAKNRFEAEGMKVF